MAGSGTAHLREGDDLLLRVLNLRVEYAARRGNFVHAVSDVSLDVRRGETLGLVGESGCGKSSTGRSIVMLPGPTAGQIIFDGTDLRSLDAERLRQVRTKLQMIFQDPISSLNPRRKIKDIVAEGMRIWGRTADDKVAEVMEAVGLDLKTMGDRYPHEFSGGQCQRICIARALAMAPEVLICDEPVSALDVSVQAQILNLLEDMKVAYRLTVVFVAHDLAVVKSISDRVAVMYLGKLCEVGQSERVYGQPRHPYTRVLLEAVPDPDPAVVMQPLRVAGEPASPLHPPSGCRFRTRCPRATERCADEEPIMREVGVDQYVACHHPIEIELPADQAPPEDVLKV